MHLDEHFSLLLSMEDGDRAGYLGELELRDPEISSILRDLFNDAPTPKPTRIEIKPGAILRDRFKLNRPIAIGAFSAVWLAKDLRLDRTCAVKVFPPSDDRAEARVMSEAQTAAKIRSEHVIEVFDAGLAGSHGALFIAMELAAETDEGGFPVGRPASLAVDCPNDVGELVELMQQICDGVSAAHRMGILHRDLKPANLFWVSGVAKVGDFGLSTACPLPPADALTATTATMSVELPGKGTVVGTPAYMAPELIAGEEASERSDIYGLGASMYHLIAKRPPYESRPDCEIPGLDVLEQVRDGKPPKLSKIAPSVPRRLVRIIERAMHRDPSARYGSADDLRFDLEAFARDRPGLIDGHSVLRRLGLFAKRNSGLLQLATLALLFIAVVGFAAFAARSAAKTERSKRIQAEQRLVDEAIARSTAEGALDRTQRVASAALRASEEKRQKAELMKNLVRRDNQRLSGERTMLVEQIEGLAAALTAGRAQTELLREAQTELTDENTGLVERIAKLETDVAQLNADLQAAQQELAKAGATTINLKARETTHVARIAELRTALAALQAEMERVTAVPEPQAAQSLAPAAQSKMSTEVQSTVTETPDPTTDGP